VGYAGSLVAFAAAFPFAAAEAYWACFLVAAALFGGFALPAFLTLPADARRAVALGRAVARGVRDTLATLREIVRAPERLAMRRFLLAYLIYEDGVNTVIAFSAVFAGKTLGFSFTEILALFMVVQVTALAGSAAWARTTDRRGPKLVVGVTLGLLSGFMGGRLDVVLMTIVDVTLSFPQLLLALAFVAALGPSMVTIIVVLGLTGWERYTRVVRAEVLALREKDFIEAARSMGVTSSRIVLRHILPNTFSSIIVLSTLQVAQAILQEAALSFLGVGSGSAYPTWGQMIALGRDFVSVAWWLPTFPGLAILTTVLAINLVGDRLRDALDPRVT